MRAGSYGRLVLLVVLVCVGVIPGAYQVLSWSRSEGRTDRLQQDKSGLQNRGHTRAVQVGRQVGVVRDKEAQSTQAFLHTETTAIISSEETHALDFEGNSLSQNNSHAIAGPDVQDPYNANNYPELLARVLGDPPPGIEAFSQEHFEAKRAENFRRYEQQVVRIKTNAAKLASAPRNPELDPYRNLTSAETISKAIKDPTPEDGILSEDDRAQERRRRFALYLEKVS